MHLGGADGQVRGEKCRAYTRPLVWAVLRKWEAGMSQADIEEVYGIPAYVTQRWLRAWRGATR